MKIIDIILVIIILVVIGGACRYIYRARKNGRACIGCPYSKECGKKKCGCQSMTENEN